MTKITLSTFAMFAVMPVHAGMPDCHDYGRIMLQARQQAAQVRENKDKEKQAQGRADSVINGATNQDIAAMFAHLTVSAQRRDALLALCAVSCEGLNGETLGTILEPLHLRESDRLSRRLEVDYQRSAIEKANIPWAAISGEEMAKNVLPKLRSENRGLAMEKWIAAQPKEKKEPSQPKCNYLPDSYEDCEP